MSRWSEPRRRRVYLMRHGAVSYFSSAGRPLPPDDVPLNDEGREQAQAAAQALAELPLDRVVTSGLPRSVETARIVAGEREVTIESIRDLREISPGKLAAIEAEGREQAFVSAFSGGLTRETRFLGGETFGSLVDRVTACFEQLLADAAWRRLLVVAHGGVNRVILCRALQAGLAGFGAIEQDPAAINVLDVDDGGRMIIRLMNFSPYNLVKEGLELTTMERLYLEYLSLNR